MEVRDANWFPLAFGVSLAVNIGFWSTLSIGASQVASHKESPLIEVTRVTLDDKKQIKVIKPKVVKPIPPPPKPKIQPKPVSKPIEQPKPKTAAPPPTAHNKVITAAPSKSGDSKPADFTVKPGGNATVGAPIEHQAEGNATANPPAQPAPQPTPTPTPQPAPPSAPAPTPPAPTAPAPKGPSMDAQPTDQVQPVIPDSMKAEDLKTFVRVRVEVAEDGSTKVVLRTSSGNPDVDKLILDALKKWKWKPALKDGQPVVSTQLFKFEIEVN